MRLLMTVTRSASLVTNAIVATMTRRAGCCVHPAPHNLDCVGVKAMPRHSIQKDARPQGPCAWSYLRFSHPSQRDGASVDRQDGLRDQWLARHPDVHFDTSLTLRDPACSGFTGEHRTNPDRHALAMFLKLVEKGRVRPGDYLIIENLDRLSREDIWPALDLVSSLVKAGVRIVQLLPVEQIIDKNSGPMVVMMVIMELSRGHGESLLKSQRVGDAWRRKREALRREGRVLTRTLPGWVREVD